MATKKTTASATPANAKSYFLVNRGGAIHEVTPEIARERLAQPGFRLATDLEIEELKRRDGNQCHDDPICAPWSPEPETPEKTEQPSIG